MSAGFSFFERLQNLVNSSSYWDVIAYWNLENEEEGKIVLRHETGSDFFLTRITNEDDEIIRIQPLSQPYSSYGLPEESVSVIEGEPLACTYISRAWINEEGKTVGKGASRIFLHLDERSCSWCSVTGISDSSGIRVSAWGGFGLIEAFKFAGGLPCSSDAKPFKLSANFWTQEGSIQALSPEGKTTVLLVHSFRDLEESTPLQENGEIIFDVFSIPVLSATKLLGNLPGILWTSNFKIALESSDGVSVYLSKEETFGRLFNDGTNTERWAVLLNPVEV